MLPDDIWKPAIEATGGKFYPAGDEQAILNAIKDIDRAVGRARRHEALQHASSRSSRGYAFMATGFWTVALTLQLTVPYFRKFP